MPSGPPIITITPLDKNKQPVTSKQIKAQFNPASLVINYASKSAGNPSNSKKDKVGKDVAGSKSQVTGVKANLSSLDLVFDTTRDGSDVRGYTLQLAALIFPAEKPNDPPTVQVQWGTLLFTGRINSMNETLEYFSELGVPLRASVKLTMTMTPLDNAVNVGGAGVSAAAGAAAGFSAGFSAGVSASAGISANASASFSASASASASANFSASGAVGTTGLTLAQSGESLQSMSARAGLDWKAVAEANGVDNPRFLQAGAVVNLNASAEAKVTFN